MNALLYKHYALQCRIVDILAVAEGIKMNIDVKGEGISPRRHRTNGLCIVHSVHYTIHILAMYEGFTFDGALNILGFRHGKNTIYKTTTFSYTDKKENQCSARDWDRNRIAWGNP
jgi:hypothetical protein